MSQVNSQTVVADIVSKLTETLETTGVSVSHDKGAEVAKLLGLVEGIRKVGGVRPTNEGYLFAGVDPADIEKAKELEKLQAELTKLQAQNAELQAKRAALMG